MHGIDNFALWLVTPLAVIFLLSGLDDLAVDFAWLYAWVAERLTVSRRAARRIPDAPPRPIAILVPLWQEHAVIARMLEHTWLPSAIPTSTSSRGSMPTTH